MARIVTNKRAVSSCRFRSSLVRRRVRISCVDGCFTPVPPPPAPPAFIILHRPRLPGATCKLVPSPPSSTRLLKWCHFDCKCISVPLFCIFICWKANISMPIFYNLRIRSGHPYQIFSKPGKVMKCLKQKYVGGQWPCSVPIEHSITLNFLGFCNSIQVWALPTVTRCLNMQYA